jgi:hypothetical protein
MRTVIAAAALALCACGVLPGPGAKLQEASQEHNVNARFGRLEMAVERVDPKAREEWARRHSAWGGKVRIADTETSGTKLVGPTEGEVTVRVAWYRADEQELHVTTLKQKWKDVNGEWKLVEEARVEGEAGLIGDAAPIAPPAGSADAMAPPKRKFFPTVRIDANDAEE